MNESVHREIRTSDSSSSLRILCSFHLDLKLDSSFLNAFVQSFRSSWSISVEHGRTSELSGIGKQGEML